MFRPSGLHRSASPDHPAWTSRSPTLERSVASVFGKLSRRWTPTGGNDFDRVAERAPGAPPQPVFLAARGFLDCLHHVRQTRSRARPRALRSSSTSTGTAHTPRFQGRVAGRILADYRKRRADGPRSDQAAIWWAHIAQLGSVPLPTWLQHLVRVTDRCMEATHRARPRGRKGWP